MALKDCKLSSGTRFQFALEEWINANTFPDNFKEGYVTPIYKKTKKHKPEIYQSILVTSTLADFFESFLLEQMSENLDMNKLLKKYSIWFPKTKVLS